jgi:hypothetical protein
MPAIAAGRGEKRPIGPYGYGLTHGSKQREVVL